jgi:hypothetical protein
MRSFGGLEHVGFLTRQHRWPDALERKQRRIP